MLRTAYTSIPGIKRGEIRKSLGSILFVFAYVCAAMGETSECFSFVYLRWHDNNGHQCANRTCGVRSAEPIAVSTQAASSWVTVMSTVGTARDMHTDECVTRTEYKFTLYDTVAILNVCQKHKGVHHHAE